MSSPALYFLLLCIPARLGIAYLASKNILSPYLAWGLLAIGVMFWWLFLSKSRLEAPEGGGVTWWNNLRPVHGTIYIIASTFLQHGHAEEAGWTLLLDVVLGLLAHVNRYWISA